MTKIPEIYTVEEFQAKQADTPWLTSNASGRLLCKVCVKVGALKTDQSQGVYIRNVWSTTGVAQSGETKAKQKASLRRKIFDHKTSASHIKAVSILRKAEINVLPEQFLFQQKGHYETTARLMRTAYNLAKNNRPFVSYSESCDLQEANGLNIGTSLHSRYSGTGMVDCIAVEMRKKLCDAVIGGSQKISIMLDESTTVSRKSCMVVYVRTVWPFEGEEECFAYPLGLVELPSMTAEAITKSLFELLGNNGFSKNFLSRNLMGACSDGASVMLGKHSGVLTRLKGEFPDVFLWHCMCHRIELAIGDAVKSVGQVNHVKSFLDKLYSVFSQSPKAQRELEECAAMVHCELLKIGRVLDVRWVASSYRSLLAVWKSYPALHMHARDSDSAQTSKHKATYNGILSVLESPQFVHNLAVMLDALESVSNLSKILQGEYCSLGMAYKNVTRCIRDLKLQKEGERGDYFQIYSDSETEGFFKGIELHSNRNAYLSKSAFLQALIDNLESRLYDQVGFASHDQFSVLLQEMDVVDPSKWPTGTQSPWPHGENLLKSLCQRFKVEYCELREPFRDYVDDPNQIPAAITKLKAVLRTLPVSSADCERGFSSMNVICSDIRNRLDVHHIDNLIFISLVGPPVKHFCPEHYVKLWLQSHRSADHFKSKKNHSHTDDRYFKIWKLF